MYRVNQSEFSMLVDDFEPFCNYIDEKKPVLSKKKGYLGLKDLFYILYKRKSP